MTTKPQPAAEIEAVIERIEQDKTNLQQRKATIEAQIAAAWGEDHAALEVEYAGILARLAAADQAIELRRAELPAAIRAQLYADIEAATRVHARTVKKFNDACGQLFAAWSQLLSVYESVYLPADRKRQEAEGELATARARAYQHVVMAARIPMHETTNIGIEHTIEPTRVAVDAVKAIERSGWRPG